MRMVDAIFYDGRCALCHALVRFTAAQDRHGRFLFAPLGGAWFTETVPESQRGALPDSVVVRVCDGRLLSKGAAVRHILKQLGPPWSFFAALAGWLPGYALDALYDRVALSRRRRPPPAEACPVVPPELRGRFRS